MPPEGTLTHPANHDVDAVHDHAPKGEVINHEPYLSPPIPTRHMSIFPVVSAIGRLAGLQGCIREARHFPAQPGRTSTTLWRDHASPHPALVRTHMFR